jgi:hypothetical protein
MQENSMPKLPEVIGGTKAKVKCQATIGQTCILAVPLTIIVGLTKNGNHAKPLTHSEKKLYILPM